jgi:hypothetical protein
MNDFIDYLDRIKSLIKSKQYDKAWALANEGLYKIKTGDRFMMYYQMAIIVAREKKWFNALEKMGFVIYYLGRLGGISHKKFIIRLLKKFEKENLFEEYVKLAKKTHPRDFAMELSSLLENPLAT